MTEDARLSTAISAIVEQASARVGMPDARVQALTLAAENAFRKICAKSNGKGPLLRFACQEFDDRIEVTLEGPAAVKAAIDAAVAELKESVDQATAEAQGENVRIKLVEFTASRRR